MPCVVHRYPQRGALIHGTEYDPRSPERTGFECVPGFGAHTAHYMRLGYLEAEVQFGDTPNERCLLLGIYPRESAEEAMYNLTYLRSQGYTPAASVQQTLSVCCVQLQPCCTEFNSRTILYLEKKQTYVVCFSFGRNGGTFIMLIIS